MSNHAAPPPSAAASPDRLAWYRRTPLYVRILISLALGIVAGELLGSRAMVFKPFSDIVLQLLRLLATPLILVAVIHALMKADVSGRTGAQLFFFLITNTIAAILIGLLVANVIQPGRWAHLVPPGTALLPTAFNPVHDLLDKVPANLIDPFLHNEIISIIIVAVSLGTALRIVRGRQIAEGKTGYRGLENFLDTAFQCVMVMLHWIFDLVPLAVFAVVARTVGTAGIRPLLSMGVFVVAVLLALALQSVFYLVRLRLGSWVRRASFLRLGRMP